MEEIDERKKAQQRVNLIGYYWQWGGFLLNAVFFFFFLSRLNCNVVWKECEKKNAIELKSFGGDGWIA